MNYYEANAARCETGHGPVEMVIESRETKMGSINLRRILPADARAAIGPFVLLDHFDPVELHPGASIDFAAPSENGVARLTYLFDGEGSQRMHGIQSWISVPPNEFGSTPSIEYHPAEDIPRVELGDATVIVVLGEIYGKSSRATRHGSTLFLVCELTEKSEFTPPGSYTELGVYVLSGCIEIDGEPYPEGTMAVAARGWPVKLQAKLESCVLIIGGQKLN